MTYDDVKDGFHIMGDGNAWVAVGPTYTNPQTDIMGYGDTPDEAYAAWRERFAKALPDQQPAGFSAFTVHPQEDQICA